MYNISVIGDKDSVSAFGTVGFDVFICEDEKEALPVLKKCAENSAIIYITEFLAENLENEILKYSQIPVPAVIVIPSVKGSSGMGMRNIRQSVIKAVGSDILSDG